MLSIRNVSKKFGDFSLQEINLEIKKGAYFVLLGASGAGKSLLFELIAGVYRPDRGEIYLNNVNITHLPMDKRKIGLVFQDNTLFPNYSVYQNIAYPLKVKNTGSEKVKERIAQLAKELNISHLLDRSLENLSGGEIQRVALARSLALDPEYLLLDEPVSSLDVQKRGDILNLLRGINQKGITILHITHHLEEAVYLAQRMAIIDHGKIIQVDAPGEIFKNPASAFISDFLGYRNIYRYKRISNKEIQIENGPILMNENGNFQSGTLIIPDYAIAILPENEKKKNGILCTILSKNEFPEYFELILDVGIRIVKKVFKHDLSFKEGHGVTVALDPEKMIFKSQ
jgi:ABC-type Fe3+/spermidine/putrescine transport system ATPase subunit